MRTNETLSDLRSIHKVTRWKIIKTTKSLGGKSDSVDDCVIDVERERHVLSNVRRETIARKTDGNVRA